VGIATDNFYVEHNFGNFTLGVQNSDWDNVGTMNDIYGQFHLTNNFRVLVGNRNFDSTSKMYAGLAVIGPLSPGWEGYLSMIGGDGFKQVQVGANMRIATNVDLNINYHSFMPDGGGNANGLGAGVSFKF
jgi:hypothetical protein